VAVLPVLAFFGRLELWHLAAVAAVVGALGSLFSPALQASLPALVPDVVGLQAMNGLMDGTWRVALAVAPSLAGVLVAVLPLPGFFALDAATFLVSAAAVASLGRRFAWHPGRERVRRSVWHEMGDAVPLVRGHPLLGWYIATNAISNMAWGAAFRVGVPLLAARAFGEGIGAYGLIVGAYGAGNIASNLVVGSITLRRRAPILIASRVVLGAGFALVALAPNVVVAMLGTAIAAIGGPMGDITMTTMMQRDLPPGSVGKVYGLRLTLGNGGMAAGLLLAGPFFAAMPVRPALALCAAVMVATGAMGVGRVGAERRSTVLALPAGQERVTGNR
jgi:hypothetical protein